jgi:hypothetical protein
MPAFRRRWASEMSSLPAAFAFDFPFVLDFVSSVDSGADDVTMMFSPSTSIYGLIGSA